MSRTKTLATITTLMALLAVTLVAGPASAGKPSTISASTVTPDGGCGVDVEIVMNHRGRLPVLVQVYYWQQGTHNGDSYWHFAPDRGATHRGNLSFSPADAAFGSTYEVGYTAFARNGQILATGILGSVDNAGCL